MSKKKKTVATIKANYFVCNDQEKTIQQQMSKNHKQEKPMININYL